LAYGVFAVERSQRLFRLEAARKRSPAGRDGCCRLVIEGGIDKVIITETNVRKQFDSCATWTNQKYVEIPIKKMVNAQRHVDVVNKPTAGVGNGNPLSLEPFQSDSRKLFYGKAMLILRTIDGKAGTVRVTAESEGLAPAEITVQCQ